MFDEIKELWLAWGLYLSTCWEHDLPFDTTELPYDYIANYERSEVDKELRLYGGEVGIFQELSANVKMISEAYKEMVKNNTITPITSEMLKNPLWSDIESGKFDVINGVTTGVSGIQWGKSEFQNGIFSYNELPYLQRILGSEEGIRNQFRYLYARIFNLESRLPVTKIISMTYLEPKAKTLLATYLYWNDSAIYWFDDFIAQGNEISTLEETADFLIGIFGDELDERTIKMFDYINDNLEGVV